LDLQSNRLFESDEVCCRAIDILCVDERELFGVVVLEQVPLDGLTWQEDLDETLGPAEILDDGV